MKKLLAVVLTLSLVMAFAGFALAEEGITPTVTETTYNTVTDATYNTVTNTTYQQPVVNEAVYSYAGIVVYNQDGVFTVAKMAYVKGKNQTLYKTFAVLDPAAIKVSGIKGLKVFTLVEKKLRNRTIQVPKFNSYKVSDLTSIPVGAKVVAKYDASGNLKEVKVVGGIINKKEMQDLMKMKKDSAKAFAAMKAKVKAEKAKMMVQKAKGKK